MPSHRKDPNCCRNNDTATMIKVKGRCGQGRAGKRRNQDLKENANRYLLNKALRDLEIYIDEYQNWGQQKQAKSSLQILNDDRFARLMDNKRILESLRDNSPRSCNSNLVYTVINSVKRNLYECFDAVHCEQNEEALIKSISNLQLLQD